MGFMKYRVEENRKIARRTWLMRLVGSTRMLHRPGQFVEIAIPGKFLRRPISVSDYDGSGITLLYDVVGEGTLEMSRLRPGDTLEMLNGLGNGFDVQFGARKNVADEVPLLIGGGIGVAPLVGLARELKESGMNPVAVFGFASGADVSGADELKALGIETHIATADGSLGFKGFVTDLIVSLGRDFGYFYACGPLPMLRAVCTQLEIPGQVSMESRMGCGFGACVCCSLELRSGTARICKEGPVFDKEEVIWK
ncbi:MAG: dihydroorotate dehydrogenase electron transfer subunit [Muribaculaceae bacterium]|nr:dihydroorotate dehydrogenase electron transfer subunit [Muribaculaceae bacterium]